MPSVTADVNACLVGEIIFDMGINIGNFLRRLNADDSDRLMDHVNGSRGLYSVVWGWANEFEDAWDKRPEAEQQDYIEAVDLFVYDRWLDLLTRAGVRPSL